MAKGKSKKKEARKAQPGGAKSEKRKPAKNSFKPKGSLVSMRFC